MSECSWTRSDTSNLGPGVQAGRMRFGIFFLAVSLAMLVVLIETGLPTWSRVFVFFPVMMAALGAYQGLFKT